MVKSLVFICVEHPQIKAAAEALGDVITSADLDKVNPAPWGVDGLDHCAAIFCDEGSRTEIELRQNEGMRNGHHYSVVKEVDYSK